MTQTALMKMTMVDSISNVLETMFFLPVELNVNPVDLPGWINGSPPPSICRLTFSGPVSGHLLAVIPEPLLLLITSDFMGEPPEALAAEHLSGTHCELVNMVAGHAFSLHDPDATFKLGIPEILTPETALPFIQIRQMLAAQSENGAILFFLDLKE